MAYTYVERVYQDENFISIEEIQEEIYYYVPVFEDFEDDEEFDFFDDNEVIEED